MSRSLHRASTRHRGAGIRRSRNPAISGAATSRAGAALVELAVVLPLFFLVIMAVLEFGRAFTLMQLVVESARNGARTAAMGGSTNASVGSQIESSLQTSAGVSPSSVAVDISIQPYSGNPAAGDVGSTHSRDLITVKVTVPYAEASFVPPMFLQTTQLTSQCTVRAE